MPIHNTMADKIFYTMGEVEARFGLPQSTLRFWEKNFPTLHPKRNKKGNRLYTDDDIKILDRIYHLVKEKGLKIEAARKQLRLGNNIDRDAELVERLQNIRSLLAEIKETIKEEEESVVSDEWLVVNEETKEEVKKVIAIKSEQPTELFFEPKQNAEPEIVVEKIEVIIEPATAAEPTAEPKPFAVEQLLF